MIAFLKGIIEEKSSSGVVLGVNGVGYFLYLSNSSLDRMPPVGGTAGLYTYLHVREDLLQLYGFVQRDEKELFEQLISVNGVGPKVALAVLSAYDAETLKKAIVAEDVEAITAIPGIGKKGAQRIILELRGKFYAEGVVPATASPADGAIYAQAHSALVALGYSPLEARAALDGYEDEPVVEALVKFALQKLALK